jgi:hypothetical protein
VIQQQANNLAKQQAHAAAVTRSLAISTVPMLFFHKTVSPLTHAWPYNDSGKR